MSATATVINRKKNIFVFKSLFLDKVIVIREFSKRDGNFQIESL